MKKKKYLILLFLLFPFFGFLFYQYGYDSFLFHRTTDAFFTQSLENDALSLHFTLAEPEKYGISVNNAALPVYSAQNEKQSQASVSAMATQLSYIRPQKLLLEDHYTYNLLTSWLEEQIEGYNYPYYEEPLSPSSGMQSELPLLFAEYTFRDKEDVDTYLSLLESVSPYFRGLIEYETEKSKAGLFMTAEDAADVVQQCDSVMNADKLLSGTHFLQTTFESRLAQLLDNGLITQQEKIEYIAHNNRLLTTVVLPAYQELGDSLILLSGSGRYSGGLCEKPDGRAYYAWLVRRTTGSTLDVDGIYLLLQKTFQKKFSDMKATLSQYRELTGNTPDPALLTNGFPLNNPSDILTDLQARMQQDFPSLSALTSDKINCTIKNVDAALESYTSPAFYMTPPIDDLLHNTICINKASTSDGIELYTTLAHEGYPGHLYQTVYSSLYSSVQNDQPVRELLYFGGYVEGWAYYTEQLSYEYAADLLTGADSRSAAAQLCRLTSLQRDLQINLFSILDIALHYYGAEKEEILQSLTSFGLPEETALRMYDYLRTSPATYLKYYVGYLEMTALRQRAQAWWGDDFSLTKFHQFVLEAGPSDFPNLTERLKSTAS
ncbi:MAG: DUF885 domain-containing protein [Lachnospiraceae bacterium]|nr:DUF885 domain-containing protein [Lachnospiraceae bacterium]